ncbi:MAG TPA: V-type ATPase subunit [Thermoclostridium caenicola]|uniref:V/A-type H+-transporting ATPase subunit C n=1 Tax=Thermoclostridium caenicola TaxID=659425 RepID=A0A1M6FS06_9FIRM|nr:V-type ATPase subunit [Thermoclostridium caenicola]SHJ00399.1 V/A-type H+-transporting ATPase subunit C [Thermoclostridium caenicola]HOK43370.1 V-type ATPase subunit [Thermoclostridium caenicola]HOL85370.1 V-type ATPase subunit [Thermoclostridium caenicola]HOP72438.1 V-type ATPase subunit [Thermoclostridium caenicola]HPO77262.1 V-type ATPase subunit [Thermoclostridium caenicola]
MARILDEDYAYATARIRAMENKLITPQQYERMLDAATAEDVVKMLVEQGYGMGSTDTAQPAVQVSEKLLSDELEKTYALLREILPDPLVVTLFMRRNDYLNAKLILKGMYLGLEEPGVYAGSGTVEPSRLRRMIVDRDLADLPEIFGKAVLECIEAYGRTSDPQMIDFILDRAMYENMEKDAQALGSPYISELVALIHDLANLRVFIRAKLLGRSRDFLAKALLEGSKISRKFCMDLSDKPLDQLFEALRFTALAELANGLSEAFKNGEGISGMEKVLDEHLMRFIRKSRYIAMGVEPVIAWLFYKEAEVRNVRLILTGKINGISNAVIRERLRAYA